MMMGNNDEFYFRWIPRSVSVPQIYLATMISALHGANLPSLLG